MKRRTIEAESIDGQTWKVKISYIDDEGFTYIEQNIQKAHISIRVDNPNPSNDELCTFNILL